MLLASPPALSSLHFDLHKQHLTTPLIARDSASLSVFLRASSPVECLRTRSDPLSREPFKSPSDRDDLISLCLSLLFTCRYLKRENTQEVGERREREQDQRRKWGRHYIIVHLHHRISEGSLLPLSLTC